MSKVFLFLIVASMLVACSKRLKWYSKKRNSISQYILVNDTTLKITGISKDLQFGYLMEKPIMIGVRDIEVGYLNAVKYLNALCGTDSTKVAYKRIDACCPFRTKNFMLYDPLRNQENDIGAGMLEKYEVEFQSSSGKKSVHLYLNIYDQAHELLAPAGFFYRVR